MPALLDLPSELIDAIVHAVGPHELRKRVDCLLVCKRWQQLALPVYLSGLNLSDVYLSAWDLARFPSSGRLFEMIAARASRLSIRIEGHCCRRIARDPWHEIEYGEGDDLADEDTSFECQTWGEKEVLGRRKNWRRDINEQIGKLADSLPSFGLLRGFHLQASSSATNEADLRWDYLCTVPLRSIILKLPPSIENLILDISGTEVTCSESIAPHEHLCHVVASRLGDFKRVRLRMRRICPDALRTHTEPEMLGSRLESLIIRLCLPMFPGPLTGNGPDTRSSFDAYPCNLGEEEWDTQRQLRKMVNAVRDLAKVTPSLKMARVSFREEYSGSNLSLVDCLTDQVMYDPCEIHCFEDDGEEWDPWEENDQSLAVAHSFEDV